MTGSTHDFVKKKVTTRRVSGPAVISQSHIQGVPMVGRRYTLLFNIIHRSNLAWNTKNRGYGGAKCWSIARLAYYSCGATTNRERFHDKPHLSAAALLSQRAKPQATVGKTVCLRGRSLCWRRILSTFCPPQNLFRTNSKNYGGA